MSKDIEVTAYFAKGSKREEVIGVKVENWLSTLGKGKEEFRDIAFEGEQGAELKNAGVRLDPQGKVMAILQHRIVDIDGDTATVAQQAFPEPMEPKEFISYLLEKNISFPISILQQAFPKEEHAIGVYQREMADKPIEVTFSTKIISGFPGVGKSECTRGNPDFLDSDSSKFSWLYDDAGELVKVEGKSVRNPDFPKNYIEHIQEQIGKVPVIFVSTHKDVRDALVANNIPFTLVYPASELSADYLQRYEDRGSPQAFVDLMRSNWDKFIGELDAQQGCAKIVLQAGQFLSDVLGQAVGISTKSAAVREGENYNPLAGRMESTITTRVGEHGAEFHPRNQEPDGIVKADSVEVAGSRGTGQSR